MLFIDDRFDKSQKYNHVQVQFYLLLLYIELFNSFLIGRKRTVNFRSQSPSRHNCRLYNNHVRRTLKVTGYHVKFACFVLLPVSEKQEYDHFFFRLMCNKTIIRFGFCDIQNNPYLEIDYSGYHKNRI